MSHQSLSHLSSTVNEQEEYKKKYEEEKKENEVKIKTGSCASGHNFRID